MKTENTCVNCAALECSVRHECEDSELPIGTQETRKENEETNVTVQIVVPNLADKAVPENWF